MMKMIAKEGQRRKKKIVKGIIRMMFEGVCSTFGYSFALLITTWFVMAMNSQVIYIESYIPTHLTHSHLTPASSKFCNKYIYI